MHRLFSNSNSDSIGLVYERSQVLSSTPILPSTNKRGHPCPCSPVTAFSLKTHAPPSFALFSTYLVHMEWNHRE